jgi:hypothetical protein
MYWGSERESRRGAAVAGAIDDAAVVGAEIIGATLYSTAIWILTVFEWLSDIHIFDIIPLHPWMVPHRQQEVPLHQQ